MSPKETLRREIKNRLAKIPGEQFYSEGLEAALLLSNSPIWSGRLSIFLFLSTNTEINTQPLLAAALKEGKKVFAPKVESGKRLVFYPVLSPEGPWHRGPFGIHEPLEGKPPEAGDFPALILTPGLAFDTKGNRLGHGAGYYDRFFSELDTGRRQYTAIGLCLDSQVISLVPAEKNDKKMNGLLTGKELTILK